MKWNILKIEKKHPTFAKEILHVYNKVITYQNVKTEYKQILFKCFFNYQTKICHN